MNGTGNNNNNNSSNNNCCYYYYDNYYKDIIIVIVRSARVGAFINTAGASPARESRTFCEQTEYSKRHTEKSQKHSQNAIFADTRRETYYIIKT